MATLDNGDKNFAQLVTEITIGQVKIPQFQRKFVWDVKASAKLLDSIVKGYPIGTFIYWRTDEELRSVRDLGNLSLPPQTAGEFVNYVLDGQQRITSFYAAVKGVLIQRDNKLENYSNIYIDLQASEEADIVTTDITGRDEGTYIRLSKLMEGDFTYLASFPVDKQIKLNEYKKIFEGYSFRGVNLKNATIDVATEVFTRLNVGGKELTLFEIMVAKTYDATRSFDLSEKYEELMNELRLVGYDTISSATILQVVAILLKKDATRKQILRLGKKEFIDMWPRAVFCIKSSVDFFRSYGVPVSRLLPYNALIVPFSYFFFLHPDNPAGYMIQRLEDFFWRCSLGFRYSSSVEGKLSQDIEKIDTILSDQTPAYEWSIDITPEGIKKAGSFSTGRSYIKAILCLYTMHKPKSFNNHLDVQIDNNWLKVSNSKNYHHFFPKAWMKKNSPQTNDEMVNHILNITIVDDYLNKRQIKAKAPSEYIGSFAIDNLRIKESLMTHLIGDIIEFGIINDDYETFFTKRAEMVSKELCNKIIDQATGNQQQEIPIEEEEDIILENHD
ncbi:GmrSD restriction endonuclease domain-containing protein [Chitinophaga sp. 22536]|uniref:GmrSD restriction endonuclease domain-containing protein n=1 Tax=unclassified Chitinophaga TaxID=2619133 RepID=UPI003F84226B